MGIRHRILAATAFAALSACNGPRTDDEARTSHQPALPQAGTAPTATAPVSSNTPGVPSGRYVEIADAGHGTTPLQPARPGLLPLERILQIARGQAAGEVIDVELEDDDDTPEYEITILTADSRSIEMKIDARSGTIREFEEE